MSTQADLDAITALINTGLRSTRKGDRSAEWDLKFLEGRKETIERELAAAAGTRPSKQYRVNVDKGI